MVDFVDAVFGESQRGIWLAGMGVNTEEFSYGGIFSSIFFEGVPDARCELDGRGDNNSLGRVNGAVEVFGRDGEPELASAGDE